MREFRLKAYELFLSKPMPTWGDTALLNEIDFADIHYFVKSTDKTERSWDDVPDDIKRTFDRLGIPEAERKFLSGVSAQYESEVVYHNTSKALDAQGVLFCDMDTAVKKYPEIVHKYFATSFRRATTSLPRSTRPCGRAARSSTCRRASKSRCRCKPISASTPRTWGSSSAR